ncbi:MAG: hypothetical protein H6861_08765 [Rhodospirillales bacterium]|nr:hypothetical protein [Rhodospirillales bacterium]
MEFTPTLKVKDTVSNVRDFIAEYQYEFWNLVGSIAPYLIICLIATLALTYVEGGNLEQEITAFSEESRQNIKDLEASRGADLSKEEKKEHAQTVISNIIKMSLSSPIVWGQLLIQLFIGYLYATMAISWHRLVLLGSRQYEPMQVLNPQRHEIEFMAMLILMNVIFPLIGWYLGFQAGLKASMALVIFSLVAFTGMIYIFYKICFFFPAKAVNANISFKKSFRLTTGYFWKIFFGCIRASLKTILFLLLYSFVVGFISTAVIAAYDLGSTTQHITETLINIPVMFYFQPLLTIIGVTVLSNYYQHALQNKSVP